ncbi:hypothetical protein PsorP6_002507 [Peronosclerospora sorghi]|uniref:Uncharacterized protein n=1 Tax=Peronosclerospora sorghi TaxID=230839 RepID=A0ACC0WRN8_9STRA|nr:hypothetical protein PsorP6_002507 [Peronosclerospora sorghi]
MYHQVGSLLPKVGQRPQFAQLYIHDTEHERENGHAVMPELNDAVLNELQRMLPQVNPYVQQFRTAREQQNDYRDIALHVHGGGLRRISMLHAAYMALQYPVLFPRGEDGWHPAIPPAGVPVAAVQQHQGSGEDEETHIDPGTRHRKKVTMADFYAYRLQYRATDGISLLKGGSLLQQYIVDAYTAM